MKCSCGAVVEGRKEVADNKKLNEMKRKDKQMLLKIKNKII